MIYSRLQLSQRAHQRAWMWAGVVGSLLLCWLAAATVIFAAAQIALNLARNHATGFPPAIVWRQRDATEWALTLLGPLWAVCSLLIAYFMGLTCAFFWHRIPQNEPKITFGTGWACWILLVAHLPLLLNGFSIFLTLISFPWMITPLWKGLEIGLDWWPKRQWRHFAGLNNEWERDSAEEA